MQSIRNNKTGYLLINLGTPDSPSVKDVRRYLGEFLMDPYVLDTPWVLRRLIVSGFILPFRPSKSAEAYEKIWSNEGSPLLVKSQELADKLQAELEAPVVLSMRYGRPGIEQGIAKLQNQGVQQICVIPLYPQYADSTVTTSISAVEKNLPQAMSSAVLPPFYNSEEHTRAWGKIIRDHLPERWDHLLFSYHGLPERHLTKADPTGQHCLKRDDCCEMPSPAHATCYRHQVYVTSRKIADYLKLEPGQFSVSFQSRLGRLPWLTPYTDKVLLEMPSKGIKNLAVACPAFVVDNLETLEEIGMQGREAFLKAGGESFCLIPCLNDSEVWVQGLARLCRNLGK
jgi:ferrochelatase